MSGIARGRVWLSELIRILGITALGFTACARVSVRAQTSQPASSSSSPAKQVNKSASAAASPLRPGTVSAGAYRNPAFGFTCKIPAGWVLRTEEMNAREGGDAKANEDKKAIGAGKAERVLL